MEVHLDPEQEARLTQIALQRGLNTGELAQRILNGYVDCDDRFLQAVGTGLAAADRGAFVEHDEVWIQVEQILRS